MKTFAAQPSSLLLLLKNQILLQKCFSYYLLAVVYVIVCNGMLILVSFCDQSALKIDGVVLIRCV
jgi:hypothetical protein